MTNAVCSKCNAAVPEDGFFCLECGGFSQEAHEEILKGFASTLKNKGATSLRGNRFNDAIETFRALVAVAPSDIEAVRLLADSTRKRDAVAGPLEKARLLLAERKYDAAKTEAAHVLELLPDNVEAVKIRDEAGQFITRFTVILDEGAKLLEKRQFEEALEKFQKALEISPHSSAVRTHVETARNRLDSWREDMSRLRNISESRSYEEAAALGQKLAEFRPFDKEPALIAASARAAASKISESRSLGKAAMEEKKWSDAVAAWKGVRELLPDDEEAKKNLESASASLARARIRRTVQIAAATCAVVVVALIFLIFFTIMRNKGALEKGRELLASGDADGALREFGLADGFGVSSEELEPLRKKARYMVNVKTGDMLGSERKWDKAAEAYCAALKDAEDPGEINAILAMMDIKKAVEQAMRLLDERTRDYPKIIEKLKSAAKNVTNFKANPESGEIEKDILSKEKIVLSAWLAQVEGEMSKRKFSALARQSGEIKKIFPDAPQVGKLYSKVRDLWLEEARALRNAGKHEEAEKFYLDMMNYYQTDERFGREYWENHADILILKAEESFKGRDYRQALQLLEEAAATSESSERVSSEINRLKEKIAAEMDRMFASALSDARRFLSAAAAKDNSKKDLDSAMVKINEALAIKGDPSALAVKQEITDRLDVPVGMVYVPAGACIIGDNEQTFWPYESPAFNAETAAYYIDVHPVTNEQYKSFLDSNKKYARPNHWTGGAIPKGLEKHPVVGVSLVDADNYAKWAGKRLPTEIEWEKAARGPGGLKYPWGGKFEPGRGCDAVKSKNGPSPVCSFPNDKSPFGCHDMAGNVWEWTATKIYLYPGSTTGEIDPDDLDSYVTKGGFCTDGQEHLRCSFRWPRKCEVTDSTVGFRCVKDVSRK
jgi:formylglycine-generating enzyme required for sulfatase activity